MNQNQDHQCSTSEPHVHIDGKPTPIGVARIRILQSTGCYFQGRALTDQELNYMNRDRLVQMIVSDHEPRDVQLLARHVYGLRNQLIGLSSLCQVLEPLPGLLSSGLETVIKSRNRWRATSVVTGCIALVLLTAIVARWTMGA